MSNHLNTSRSESLSQYDVGLRLHFARVYKIMSIGLFITALVSFFTSQSPQMMQAIHGTWLGLVVALAPLGIIFFGLSPQNVRKMNPGTVQAIFYGFSGLLGLSLSYIFAVYTGISILRVFFITAITFGAMSIWGYTTKRDLSKMGSFLFMGLIGIIIASIVNIFLQSPMLMYFVSGAGVIVFTLLIAFDTQNIKETYNEGDSAADQTKLATMSALSMYLNVINLFQFLLMFLGNRE